MENAPHEPGAARLANLPPDELARLVSPPAIAMIVLASLSLLARIVESVFGPVARALGWLAHEADIQVHSHSRFLGVLDFASDLFGYAITAVVLLGSVLMLQQRSWPLSVAAAVLISVPCFGPCCPIGIPVGIWALMVLLRPEVRAALERNG